MCERSSILLTWPCQQELFSENHEADFLRRNSVLHARRILGQLFDHLRTQSSRKPSISAVSTSSNARIFKISGPFASRAYAKRQSGSPGHWWGAISTIPGSCADCKRAMARLRMSFCIILSNGTPQGLPSGKSVYRYLGAPHRVTISRAEPIITVAMP